MPTDGVRLSGTVETIHTCPGPYGGGYGVILASDGKRYVWSSANVFRNFSTLDAVGAKVTFEVVAWSYAANIDRADKHAVKRDLPPQSV